MTEPATIELRCDSKLHGIVRGMVLEVKCSSRFCGAHKDEVVLHEFDLVTGEETTRIFKDPVRKGD